VKAILLVLFFTGVFHSSARHAYDDHDIHLSLCELRYNESSSSFEVAVKIFIDDLEKAIEKEGASRLRIGSAQEDALADEHIARYLDKYFTITVDGGRLMPDYLGKEMTEDMLAVWCYVEYSKELRGAQSCTLSNRILLDVYDDQRNIMDIRMSKSHKDYTIFESGKSTWSYKF
jgi:hypothetical protein